MKLDVPFNHKTSIKEEFLKRFDKIKGCILKETYSGAYDHYDLKKEINIWKFKMGSYVIASIMVDNHPIDKEFKMDIKIEEKGQEFVKKIMNILIGLEEDFKDKIEIEVKANFKHPMFDKIKCAEEL